MTYEIVMYSEIAGVEMQNTFAFDSKDLDVLPPPEDTAQGIVDAWTAHLGIYMSQFYQIKAFAYRDLPSMPGQPYIPLNVSNLPRYGNGGQEATARQVCMIINKRSTTQAPWRGSIKLAGWDEGAFDTSGNFSPNRVDAAQDFADAIQTIAPTTGESAHLITVSRGTATVPAGQYSFADVVTPNRSPGTLRSRRK